MSDTRSAPGCSAWFTDVRISKLSPAIQRATLPSLFLTTYLYCSWRPSLQDYAAQRSPTSSTHKVRLRRALHFHSPRPCLHSLKDPMTKSMMPHISFRFGYGVDNDSSGMEDREPPNLLIESGLHRVGYTRPGGIVIFTMAIAAFERSETHMGGRSKSTVHTSPLVQFMGLARSASQSPKYSSEPTSAMCCPNSQR